MNADVLDRLRAAAARLFPARGILAAYVHGSRVSGRPRTGSDLDVGYYLAGDRAGLFGDRAGLFGDRAGLFGDRAGHRLSLREEMTLQSALLDAVGLEVDLRDLAEAPLELRGRVLEDGLRIYSGDDVARVGYLRDGLEDLERLGNAIARHPW